MTLSFLENEKRRKRNGGPGPSGQISVPSLSSVSQFGGLSAPSVLQAGPAQATPETLRAIQRSHGNQFVQRWLQGGSSAIGDTATGSEGVVQRTPVDAGDGVIQRQGKKKKKQRTPEQMERRREANRRKRARRKERKAEEHNAKHGWFGSETWLGKAAGWFSYGSHEVEDSKDFSYTGGEWEEVEDDFEEEEEQESILSLNKIEINLKEGEFERGGLSGKGELKGGLEGLKGEGELAYDGTDSTTTTGSREYGVLGQKISATGTRQKSRGLKAKASTELSTSLEKTEGKGEISFVYGSSDKVSGTLGWDVAGSHLEGMGSVSHFSGGKLGMKGRGSYEHSTGGFSAKGKASAFLGESVDVKIKVGSEDLGTFKGNAGLSYGIGGELSGSISWSGGTLTLAGKGKGALGLGMSMGYHLEINTSSLGSRFWNWLSGWGSWAWDVLDSVDEPLLL